ncbi:MAG: T9SS type A sorting domain-containing protein [Bacteroidota bacterium]
MLHGKLYCFLLLLIPMLGSAQLSINFNPIPASFNINSSNPLYALDVSYDVIEPDQQAFHLFLPDSTGAYPLVVYIHGGGFNGGTRDVVIDNENRRADIKYFLEQGIAYASIDYRLLPIEGVDPEGVIKPLNDSKRALQFIRHYADELHIQPGKIVLTGGSAGAGTSLWLATRSDMADPEATDPVLRASTRVCAAALSASQSTYDLYKWETEVYDNFDGEGTNYTIDSMVNLLSFERYSSFYGGLDSNYQLIHDPFLIQYREDIDMLFHMSADDPPIYIRSQSGAVHPGQDLFHHSFHGREIHTQALAAGLPEVKAVIPAQGINTTEGESINAFLERHLATCSLTTEVEMVEQENKVRVYPNPANDRLFVKASSAMIEEIHLYSLAGQLLRSKRQIKAQYTLVDTVGLPKGIYLLTVLDSAGKKQVQRVVIQ